MEEIIIRAYFNCLTNKIYRTSFLLQYFILLTCSRILFLATFLFFLVVLLYIYHDVRNSPDYHPNDYVLFYSIT